MRESRDFSSERKFYYYFSTYVAQDAVILPNECSVTTTSLRQVADSASHVSVLGRRVAF